MGEYFDFLRDVYFFRDLSDEEIRAIEERCKDDEFQPGEIIFRENAAAERFYIVLDGMVEVWKDYAAENPDLLAVHGKGHLFGEMALIDELPRSATVVAKTPTHVLYLFREEFDQIVRHNSAVAVSILRSLSAMVRKSNESFVEDLRRRNLELERANAELREAQEELIRAERLSNLGKFSTMILHDIRNPLAILKGYAEMIGVSADQPERVKKYSESAVREADRLNQLATELLDYSRGEIRLNMQVSSVGRIFARMSDYMRERFVARGMELHLDNQVSEPVVVDEERLVRVLTNIADNARKAMTKGGTLEIRATREGDTVHLIAKDTGAGMPPEVLRRVFEPFYSSSSQGGTGLGLVIVKSIIEAHRGSLEIDSEVGAGTTVRIDLPVGT